MKKTVLLVLTLVVVMFAFAALCACDSKEEGDCVHNFDEWTVSKQATCTEEGVEERVCSLCGKKENRPVEALGHTGGQPTCTQQAVCSRCDTPYGEFANHALSDFILIEDATCTDQGERKAECSECGYIETEIIPAKGHSGEWKTVAEPRCFDDGERQRICTVCNELEEEALPAYGEHDLEEATCVGGMQCTRCNYVEGNGKGHAFSEWSVTKSATCIEDGIETRYCLVCGDEETRTFNKTGHSGTWNVLEAPTCTQNGVEERYCTECGMYETRTAYRTGHSGEWVEVSAATCTENGYSERICDKCGYKETVTIYAAHVYGDWWQAVAPTCTESGYERRDCINCGKQQERKVAKTAHVGEWIVIVEPTCTENGAKTRTCEVCGQGENAAIEKLGHDFSEGTCTEAKVCSRCGVTEYGEHVYGEEYLIIDPDCERNGIVWLTCSVCGHVEEVETPNNGHEYGEWTVVEEPTCIAQGKERCFCAVCEKAFDRVLETIDHEMGEWVVTTQATCSHEGEKVRKCTMCDYTEKDTVSRLDHTIVPATCTTDEMCSVCGYIVSKAPGHLYGENGCDRCGTSFSSILTYELTEDGNSYRITGGNFYYFSGELLVPDTYNGLPVTEIGAEAFIDCPCSSVYIPASIVSIGNSAFDNYDITSVIFEEGSALESIGDYAFSKSRIKEIRIPEGVKSIGQNAICMAQVVHLPAGIEYLGALSIGNYNSTVVFCEDSVQPSSWDPDWFRGGKIYWGVGDDSSVRIDGIVYVVEGDTATVAMAEKWVKGADIPETVEIGGKEYVVEKIGTGSFENCTQLEYVKIARSIKEIGGYVFYSCEKLKTLFIPKEVEVVGNNLFSSCYDLTAVYCEKESMPESWDIGWAVNVDEVVWGASEQDVLTEN